MSQFLICGSCGAVAELDDPAIAAALRRAGELGFLVELQTIELRGLCPRCRHPLAPRGGPAVRASAGQDINGAPQVTLIAKTPRRSRRRQGQ